MKFKIKEYISNCLKCLHFSSVSGKKEGVLHNIPKGNLPFDVVHIDHFGPLPSSRNKKNYVFLIIDGFTKFVKLYAVKSTSTKEVIQCLQNYFNSFSRPNKIISDRGSCFTSDEFSIFCKDQNIQHIKVATASPQSNGQVERVNRVLIPMLSKESNSDIADWANHLLKIEFAMNNVRNRSTGSTVIMLLFGVEQKGEVANKILEHIQKEMKSKDKRILKDIMARASENIKRNQEYNKWYFDKRHKAPHKYKVGDYVLIKNFVPTVGVNKKLIQKYKGPYVIEKIFPNDRYKIRDVDGMQVSRVAYNGVCSPENMKPYCFNNQS